MDSPVEQLAQEHELTPTVDQIPADIKIPHIDQTNENDANFLTRLGQRYDVIAPVKDEHLLFVRRGRGAHRLGKASSNSCLASPNFLPWLNFFLLCDAKKQQYCVCNNANSVQWTQHTDNVVFILNADQI